MQKAQTAAEYVTLMALIFVLVASLMLISFRQQETNIALATARLACMEYTSVNSSIACYELRYYYTGSQNITVVPISDITTLQQQGNLTAIIVKNWLAVFHPQTTVPGLPKCVTAAYYSYCVTYP